MSVWCVCLAAGKEKKDKLLKVKIGKSGAILCCQIEAVLAGADW